MTEKKLIHTKNFEIRWGDMDAYGHMNNTMYLFYTQEARFELLTDNGIEINLNGIAPVLAYTTCKFIKPIMYPESILVETWLVSIENKKTTFEHIIKSKTNPELVYAIAEAIIVWYDFSTKKSIEMPSHLREIISK